MIVNISCELYDGLPVVIYDLKDSLFCRIKGCRHGVILLVFYILVSLYVFYVLDDITLYFLVCQ